MTSFNWIILMEKFAGRVLGKLSGTSLPERGAQNKVPQCGLELLSGHTKGIGWSGVKGGMKE